MGFFNDYGLKSRNIPLIYFPKFIGGMLFFLPILALYYQATLFTVTNVAIIFSVQAFASFLFEIPTGAVADLFGRKNTFSLAYFVSLISLVFLYIGGSIGIFIVAAILNSLANSLASGTDSALIYDTLKAEGKEGHYKKVIGRYNSLWPIGASIGSIIGGYLASISLSLAVLLSGVPIMVAFVLTLFLEEPDYEKAGHTDVLRHMKESLGLVFKSRQLMLLMFGALILFGIGEGLSHFNPLFLEYKGIAIVNFGYVYAVLFAFAALGIFYSHDVSERFGNKLVLILALVSTIAFYLLATLTDKYIAVFFLAVISVFYGLRVPVINHLINLEVVSSKRATVLSVHNFMVQFGVALFSPFIGYFADLYTINTAYFISALMLVSVVVLFMLVEDKK